MTITQDSPVSEAQEESPSRPTDSRQELSPASTRIYVTKRDGTRIPYNADRINKALERAAEGLPDPISKVTQVASELEITLFDGITTEQLDEAAIAAAIQNVKDDPDFDVIAARLLRKVIAKRVLGPYETDLELHLLHRARFPGYVRDAVEDGILDPRLAQRFDLDELAAALDPTRDDLLRYIGTVTMHNRYMIDGADHRTLEVPQYFWMRVAMGLTLNEKDATAAAIDIYNKISKLDYLPAGSTLANAGTSHPQLSNCFVMQMEDDIGHIAKTVSDVMWLTKGTGGIGLSVTKLRSEGSPIKSNNTTSTGPIPFMHTIDSTLRAVSRGGKKFGALCFYMENWHLDFGQFLDLRQNAGDPYRRTRTANIAVWISDEFMKRVASNDDWYLFDPADTPDLVDLYGADFSARYAEYIELAEAGKMRAFKRVRAREQWTAMLVMLQGTSHPWLTWKDSINLRALNNNTGTIHLSNLCTEITLPQDRDNIAVCNLASINLSTHLISEDGVLDFDWERLKASVKQAVRGLDNLVDITRAAVNEADHANEQNRAVGLGLMGFTDVVEKMGFGYESEQAYDLIDTVTEFISYHAIDTSADLAQERGSYKNFEGSGWSKGMIPYDTLDTQERDRGLPVKVNRTMRQDWDSLREKVKRGMRNATLMAIAPTASIGLVAGTTPGLDPQFSQIFARSTSSGKFLEVNRNLVADLQELGLWEQVREDLLVAQGDVDLVDEIPEHIKKKYRTSFQVSPYAFIEVAGRAQKWIDQAISRNIYLADRDIEKMSQLYQAAWEYGVKTTYYLHIKPRHGAEQSTTKVNKAKTINTGPSSGSGRRGFGGFARGASATTSNGTAQNGAASQNDATQNGAVTARAPEPAAPKPAAPVAKPAAAQTPSSAPSAKGFGAALANSEPVTEPTPPPAASTPAPSLDSLEADIDVVDGVQCPIDPQERNECDSCQ